jgi:hypothetical protein
MVLCPEGGDGKSFQNLCNLLAHYGVTSEMSAVLIFAAVSLRFYKVTLFSLN